MVELDLDVVREGLLQVMKGGHLSHAYLLLGPRGSGKTSTARILARVINCLENKEGSEWKEACGKCEMCKLMDVNSAVDILEMDAASHRGIDDIRELREKVRLAPTQLRKKIYIIDEVHMLTSEAFNALLKTLEEPPEHVVFFLCTTEGHKVPETIVSRCTKIVFSKATKEEVKRSLNKAVTGENLDIEDEAFNLLAESVDGSFREGHKLLEQLAVGGIKITEDLVRSSLKLVGGGAVSTLVSAVFLGEVDKIGNLLDEQEAKGVSADSFVKELLAYLKNQMRLGLAEGRNIREMAKLMEKVIKASEKIKISPLPYLPIELVMTKSGLKKSTGGGGQRLNIPTVHVNVDDKDVEVERVDVAKEAVEDLAREDRVKPIEEMSPLRDLGEIVDFKQVVKQWNDLLIRLTPKNQSLVGLLRSAKPKEMDANNLMVEVYYKFHKEQLEMDSRRKVVEDEMRSMWGPVHLKCVLGEKAEIAAHDSQVGDGQLITPVVKTEEILAAAAEEIFG